MTHRFRPGQLVEVVATVEEFAYLRGERFVLERHAAYTEPAWESPFIWRGIKLIAEERCLKPIDDGSFERFMERVLKPVDLGVPVKTVTKSRTFDAVIELLREHLESL